MGSGPRANKYYERSGQYEPVSCISIFDYFSRQTERGDARLATVSRPLPSVKGGRPDFLWGQGPYIYSFAPATFGVVCENIRRKETINMKKLYRITFTDSFGEATNGSGSRNIKIYRYAHSEKQAATFWVNAYLISTYGFVKEDGKPDWEKVMKYRNKWLHDIQVTQVTDNLAETESERCEAEAHNANNKKKGDEKMEGGIGIPITIRSGSKTLTRKVKVYVKVDNNHGVLYGYVGRCAFYWDPGRYDLPKIKLTKEDERKLFLLCRSSQERHKKYQRMRRLVKAFLCAYWLRTSI